MTYEVTIAAISPGGVPARTYRVEILRDPESGHLVCRLDGAPLPLDVAAPERGVLSLLFEGRSYEVRLDRANGARPGAGGGNGSQAAASGELNISVGGRAYRAEVRDPRSLRARRIRSGAAEGPRKITAPMPGKVVRILAPEGAAVEAGQGVLVIEAMKMQNEMKSPTKGTVARIAHGEGATVNPGDTLAVIE
jgi:biotin carboxyl carrier protein